jgi:hypothetical protein
MTMRPIDLRCCQLPLNGFPDLVRVFGQKWRTGDNNRLFPEKVNLQKIRCWSGNKSRCILATKAQDANAGVTALERELDELVYALYGLTPEEIQLVEGAAK